MEIWPPFCKTGLLALPEIADRLSEEGLLVVVGGTQLEVFLERL